MIVAAKTLSPRPDAKRLIVDGGRGGLGNGNWRRHSDRRRPCGFCFTVLLNVADCRVGPALTSAVRAALTPGSAMAGPVLATGAGCALQIPSSRISPGGHAGPCFAALLNSLRGHRGPLVRCRTREIANRLGRQRRSGSGARDLWIRAIAGNLRDVRNGIKGEPGPPQLLDRTRSARSPIPRRKQLRPRRQQAREPRGRR